MYEGGLGIVIIIRKSVLGLTALDSWFLEGDLLFLGLGLDY